MAFCLWCDIYIYIYTYTHTDNIYIYVYIHIYSGIRHGFVHYRSLLIELYWIVARQSAEWTLFVLSACVQKRAMNTWKLQTPTVSKHCAKISSWISMKVQHLLVQPDIHIGIHIWIHISSPFTTFHHRIPRTPSSTEEGSRPSQICWPSPDALAWPAVSLTFSSWVEQCLVGWRGGNRNRNGWWMMDMIFYYMNIWYDTIIYYYIILYYIIYIYIISYHIISYHIISSNQIISCRIVSYHITSHHIRSIHVISYHIVLIHLMHHCNISSLECGFHSQRALPSKTWAERWLVHSCAVAHVKKQRGILSFQRLNPAHAS